jgi:hypothetical protein
MAKKEYLETICERTVKFHRRRCYDVTYMKTNGLVLNEINGIQNIGIKGSEGYIIADQRHVLIILGNYITEFYDEAEHPENLGAEHKEEAGSDEKVPNTSPLGGKSCQGDEGSESYSS